MHAVEFFRPFRDRREIPAPLSVRTRKTKAFVEGLPFELPAIGTDVHSLGVRDQ